MGLVGPTGVRRPGSPVLARIDEPILVRRSGSLVRVLLLAGRPESAALEVSFSSVSNDAVIVFPPVVSQVGVNNVVGDTSDDSRQRVHSCVETLLFTVVPLPGQAAPWRALRLFSAALSSACSSRSSSSLEFIIDSTMVMNSRLLVSACSAILRRAAGSSGRSSG